MISILMPLYNGKEFLSESARSVIDQTYKDWELLIGINGLEQQECYEIFSYIRSFNDDRIRSSRYDFKSKTKTLNKLAECAKYDYICLLDVDDVWFPQKLERQLQFIDKYDVVGSDAEYIGDKDGTPGLFLGRLTIPMFIWQNPVVNSAAMLKKKDAWWDEDWEGLDDYYLWVHLLAAGKIFYNIPEILLNLRLHDTSYFNKNNMAMVGGLKEKKLRPMTDNEWAELCTIYDSKAWLE
jgi:teichuronic acid biosynthesis glycosyltransferase TuaG